MKRYEVRKINAYWYIFDNDKNEYIRGNGRNEDCAKKFCENINKE